MAGSEKELKGPLFGGREWPSLIDDRRPQLRRFLQWAAACEAGTPRHRCGSRTETNSSDAGRSSTCSASRGGAPSSTPASTQSSGLAPRRRDSENHCRRRWREKSSLASASPASSVQHHRAQATLERAKWALVSACANVDELREVLCVSGPNFDDRFRRLEDLRIRGWGRTTCFDVLARSGTLWEVCRVRYRPAKAYLADSTGPRSGFERDLGHPGHEAQRRSLRAAPPAMDQRMDRGG